CSRRGAKKGQEPPKAFEVVWLGRARFHRLISQDGEPGAALPAPGPIRWLGANAAQLLHDRDLVPVDARDALATALGSLLAQPIGLLLALAKRVRALPERDHDPAAACSIREPDRADVPFQLAHLRERLRT